jgi:transposase
MINNGSVRFKNKEKFKRCIQLRKQGLSYREIRKIVPVAKSTLQNWLTSAGLTLRKEHLEIQVRKRLENQ